MTLREIKKALRAGPYAWPGGYPLYFIATNGDPLSSGSVRAGWRNVCESHIKTGATCWDVSAIDINWEDSELCCAETGKRIESAYAD